MYSFFWKWYSLESFVGPKICKSKRWDVYLNFVEISTFTNSMTHDTLKKYTFSLTAMNKILEMLKPIHLPNY